MLYYIIECDYCKLVELLNCTEVSAFEVAAELDGAVLMLEGEDFMVFGLHCEIILFRERMYTNIRDIRRG